jgi:hypothetical protein
MLLNAVYIPAEPPRPPPQQSGPRVLRLGSKGFVSK